MLLHRFLRTPNDGALLRQDSLSSGLLNGVKILRLPCRAIDRDQNGFSLDLEKSCTIIDLV